MDGGTFISTIMDTNMTIPEWCVSGSHLSARQDVSGQFDLGEVAFADGLEQPVVPHVGLLRFLRAAGAHAGAARPRADLLAPIAVRRVLWNETQTR